MIEKMYRQGDLLLIKRDSNPLNVEARTNVLLEGTLTGHHHKIVNGKVFFKPIDNNHVFAFVMAEKDCKLVHEEHKEIFLPDGVYECRRQREVKGYVQD